MTACREWHLWIGNRATPSRSHETIEVRNPATGAVIAEVPAGGASDADAALQDSAKAYPGWRRTPAADRSRLQHGAAALMRDHADELGMLLTQELGRPLKPAREEVERSADLLDYFAEEGLRLFGEMPLLNEAAERVLVTREPLGVVVAIAPFNYPLTLLTFKLGAAVITGNTVVAKPSAD